MKNLVFKVVFCLFALTICSFQAPKPTVQEIFQEALNIKSLAEHLAKDANGEMLPLTIVTNGLLSEKIKLSMNGKVIAIVPTNTNNEFDTNSILDLKELKMKGKKSYLVFKYGDKNIKIRLKQEDGNWTAKTISVKWKKGMTFKTVSTSEEHF